MPSLVILPQGIININIDINCNKKMVDSLPHEPTELHHRL